MWHLARVAQPSPCPRRSEARGRPTSARTRATQGRQKDRSLCGVASPCGASLETSLATSNSKIVLRLIKRNRVTDYGTVTHLSHSERLGACWEVEERRKEADTMTWQCVAGGPQAWQPCVCCAIDTAPRSNASGSSRIVVTGGQQSPFKAAGHALSRLPPWHGA